MNDDPVAQLRERLGRYTADHHPLQHATAQFHLGGALLGRGDLPGAEEAFTIAAGLFGLRGARPEQAKALNGLGATLREAGRVELAARAFEHAAAGLAAARLPLDEGAARYNLGLVLRASGRTQEAAEALSRALELLDPREVPAQAAAAARELGASRLELGDAEAAEAVLTEAMALADRVGDVAGRGAAANALGIARLADERPPEAVEAFAVAVAANPRALRPDAFAMAEANLALACERSGDAARARLGARRALGVPEAPVPVREQAAAVLERLGPPGAADLRALFEREGPVARERLVRDELARSAGAPEEERVRDAREWIELHTRSGLGVSDVAQFWLGGLLEQPPASLEDLVRAALRALADVEPLAAEEFRDGVRAAMARFHIPQWMRLQDVFSAAADAVGDPGPWR